MAHLGPQRHKPKKKKVLFTLMSKIRVSYKKNTIDVELTVQTWKIKPLNFILNFL